MRRVLGIAAVCFALGCGDDDGGEVIPPAELLDGQWIRDEAVTVCMRFLGFKASNGVAVAQVICELTDGTIGAQVRVGTFEADSDTIRIYYEESSCAGESREPDVLWYQIDGSQLNLGTPDRLVIYERDRATSGGSNGQRGAAVTFGCFDEDGLFTPRPVQPI